MYVYRPNKLISKVRLALSRLGLVFKVAVGAALIVASLFFPFAVVYALVKVIRAAWGS